MSIWHCLHVTIKQNRNSTTNNLSLQITDLKHSSSVYRYDSISHCLFYPRKKLSI